MKCLKKLIAIAGAVIISNSIIFSTAAIKISPYVKNTSTTAKNIRKTVEEIENNISMTRALQNKRKLAVLEQSLSSAVKTTNVLIESAHEYIKSRLNELSSTSGAKDGGIISNLIYSTSSSLQKLKSTLDNFDVENIHSTMIIYNYVNKLQHSIQSKYSKYSTIDMIHCWKREIDNAINNFQEIEKENSDVNIKLDKAEIQKECDDLYALIEEYIKKGIESINQDIDDSGLM